jgi:nucleotide-binding universal stress UspA family protein
MCPAEAEGLYLQLKEFIMFKHILLPIDGSELSEKAIQGCVSLAKESGAKITGLHVTPEFHVFTANPEMLEDTEEEYRRDSKRTASDVLSFVEKAAKGSGVPCEIVQLESDHPHQAIIDTAEQYGCDLITMATHAYTGVKGLLLGSETHKVLTQCKVPVLVYR